MGRTPIGRCFSLDSANISPLSELYGSKQKGMELVGPVGCSVSLLES